MTRWQIMMDLDDTLMPTNWKYIEASNHCVQIITRALGFRSPYPLIICQMAWDMDQGLAKELGFKIDRFPLSWIRTYELLCKQLEVNPDQKISHRLQHTASRFRYGPFRAFPGVPRELRRLMRRGHQLHLVTVGDDRLQNRKIDQIGIRGLFESVFIVEREKKPTLAAIKNDFPGPWMMIGDSKEKDILPANDLGIVSVWIPSQSRTAVDDVVQPNHVLRSFDGVYDLIQKLDKEIRK